MEGCLIRANDRALYTMSEGPIVRFGSADGVAVGLQRGSVPAYLENASQNIENRTTVTLEKKSYYN